MNLHLFIKSVPREKHFKASEMRPEESPWITPFPFRVNTTLIYTVCYILFSQLSPQNQFTFLLFFTLKAFPKAFKHKHGVLYSPQEQGKKQRDCDGIPTENSWIYFVTYYLLAIMKLDFLSSCFIAKNVEFRKKPGYSI